VLHIALTQVLHQQSAAINGLRRQQQMHVIGHEAVGMHRTAEAVGKLLQVVQIERVILFMEKTGAAIVAALDDVHGDLRDHEALVTRHRHAPRVVRRRFQTYASLSSCVRRFMP